MVSERGVETEGDGHGGRSADISSLMTKDDVGATWAWVVGVDNRVTAAAAAAEEEDVGDDSGGGSEGGGGGNVA